MANPNPSPETRFNGPRGNKPGITSELARLREKTQRIAAKGSPRVMKRVLKQATGEVPPDNGELAAAKEVLDRGLGKPSQGISIEVVQKIQDETRQMIQALTNALDPFPEAKAAAIAALEPYLGAVQSDS